MRNLIRFLVKNRFFFFFLLLEFVAISLLVQNNGYQSAKFFNSSNFLVGNLYSSVNGFKDYFNLKEVSDELAEQNLELQATSVGSFSKMFGGTVQINDTSYLQLYTYTLAKVVNNSVNKQRNYLTLNRGAINGVEEGMSVITPSGIVGIVKSVSNHYASVMSVLHNDIKISGKIKKSGYFGSLIWEGDNYRLAKLSDIPNHVEMNIGDTVVTSGYSTIFPENVLIGTVKDFSLPEGNSFYDVTVQFSTDYKSLAYVFVVKNLMKGEQQELEALNEEKDD